MNKSHIYNIDGLSDQQIIDLIRKIVSSSPGCGAARCIKATQNKALQNAICRLTNFFDANPDYSFINMQTRIYMLVHDLTEKDFPRCIHCGKIIKQNVVSIHQGFIHEACSSKCAARSNQRKQKIEQTNLDRHGQAKWSNGKKISESLKNMDPQKRAQTTQKFKKTRQRHIDENPNYWKERDYKGRQTKLARYGSEVFNNNEKASATKYSRTEADPMYFKKQQEKAYQTKVETYGIDNISNQKKARETCLDRYGVEHWSNPQKTKQTCLEKYGVDNVMKLDSTKQQVTQTCLDRYGSPCYLNSKIGKATIQQTCIERYGTPCFVSSEQGRKMTSLRHAKDTWKKVNCHQNEVQPMFTFEDVVAKTPLTMFKWRCKKCGNVFESPINFISARTGGQFARCLKCYPLPFKKSTKQCDVYNYIKSIYSGEVRFNDRTQIHPYEIDIYLPALKIGIEFDGLYWHSELGGANRMALAYKTKICKDKGISLIHLYEDEWDNRKTQCKARLKEIVCIHKTIEQNDAQIIYLDYDEMQRFLDKNSNDLFAKASNWNNIGIVVDGILVSGMALSKTNGKLVIGSFCNVASNEHIDCTEMLINYAIEDVAQKHNLQTIQISIDNRWPISHRWLDQFQFVKQTRPAFWLINSQIAWKRCNKGIDRNSLKPYGLKENESIQRFMDANNMTFIADCGQLVYQHLVV